MIPIFIISCDRLKVLKESIQSYYDCIKTPFEIVIIDFGSTYEPTLEYLRYLEYGKIKVHWEEKVVYKGGLNIIGGIVRDYFKDHPASNYVVTDPDIALDSAEGDVLDIYAHLLEKLPEIVVAGPMLRIDDIPDCYPRKKEVINWEVRLLSGKVNAIQYKDRTVKYAFVKIDTTFGMNRTGHGWKRHMNGVRVLSPYSARHLDWYLDPNNLTEDQKYYIEHASERIATWTNILRRDTKMRI